MRDTAIIRIRRSTHARIEAQRKPGQTADDLINEGLTALARNIQLRQAEADSREAAKDPDDRAEVRAAIREMLGE